MYPGGKPKGVISSAYINICVYHIIDVLYSDYEVLDCGVRSSYPRRAIVKRVLVVLVTWCGGDLPRAWV